MNVLVFYENVRKISFRTLKIKNKKTKEPRRNIM